MFMVIFIVLNEREKKEGIVSFSKANQFLTQKTLWEQDKCESQHVDDTI